MKLSDIHSNPSNPRLIKDDRFKKLVKSIEEFPKMMSLRPIIIDADGMILGGNMRFKALKELKYKEVPDEWVKRADSLTDEEKQRFIIEDNVPFGEWDFDILANEWDAVQLAEWGLEIPDFAVNKEVTEDDYEIPDEIKTDIVLGDLFEIGQHRLLCGDSTNADDVAKLMNGQKADMVFTDPPYNVNYSGRGQNNLGTIKNDNLSDSAFEQFCRDIFTSYSLSLKPLGCIYVCHPDSHSAPKLAFEKTFAEQFQKSSTIIWVKQAASMGWQDYRSQHEPILYGWKEGKGKHSFYGDRAQTTVWECSRDAQLNYKHPTQKPVVLPSKAINNSSKEEDIISDLFLGSGTTMVAAHQLNRKCYGMEIDPKYCQVIVDRMRKLDPALEIKRNGKTEG
jgi:DNA modification methylase